MEIIKISDKKVSWEDDAERLVLYADIMGFSHRVTFNNHEELNVICKGLSNRGNQE